MSIFVNTLETVRRRLFMNRLLRDSLRPVCAVLLLLIIAAASINNLGWVPLAGSLALAAAIAASMWIARRRKLSLHTAAIHLDREAGLQDRLSTALYFSDIEQPEGILKRQRQDALDRLALLDVRALAPLRIPAGARYAAALAVVAAALFGWRVWHGAPLPSALRAAASMPLVKSLVSPMVHAMERTLQTAKNKPPAEPGMGEVRAGDEPRGEQANESGGASDGKQQQGKSPGDGGESSSDQQREDQTKQDGESKRDAGGDGAGGMPDGSGQQKPREGSENSSGQESGENGEQEGNNSGGDGNPQNAQAGDRPSSGDNGRNQSLARSMMQALKNLMSKLTGGQQSQAGSPNNENGSQSARDQSSQPQSQSSSASGNPQQTPQSGKGRESGNESQQRAASGSQDSGQQKSGVGVGQQPGADQAAQDQALPDGQRAPDRVGLETHPFSGEAQVRARPGGGTLRTPSRAGGSPGAVRVTGSEQENIPQRYRHYLRRYFAQGQNDAAGNAPPSGPARQKKPAR